MRKIAANFAAILLFAITLFFLGPQFGSLDIDGDGIADVPVMVMHKNDHQKVHLPQSKSQTKVGLATASPFLGLMCNDVVLMKERIVVEPRGTKLDSVVPLRC
jgi:hypothetical protein